MPEIREIEIFATGTWNGDVYDLADLQEMAANFGKTGFQVPLILGHTDKVGDRAWGWIKNVYVRGTKLLADIGDIPAELFTLIRQKAYNAVSSEIYHDIERGGKKFRRALRAVALLGAETPAVNLAPIHTSLSMPVGRYRSYIYRPKRPKEETMNIEDPTIVLQNLADDLAIKLGIDTGEAMARVLKTSRGKELANAQVHHQRARQADFAQRAEKLYARSAQVSATLHEYALSAQKANPKLSYREAVQLALVTQDDLREDWNPGKQLMREFNPAFRERAEIDQRCSNFRSDRADAAIDRKAREYLETSGTTDYAAAVSAVLTAEPALARQYAEERASLVR